MIRFSYNILACGLLYFALDAVTTVTCSDDTTMTIVNILGNPKMVWGDRVEWAELKAFKVSDNVVFAS